MNELMVFYQALVVWGRVRFLSVTETLNNTESVGVEESFVTSKPENQSRGRTRDLQLFRQTSLTLRLQYGYRL